MNGRSFILTAAAWLAASTLAWAVDDVVNTTEGRVAGKVTQITPNEITVERGGAEKTIAVNEVENVIFGDEPSLLRGVRNACHSGHYDEAIEALDRINADEVEREEVKQDLQYYRALAMSKAAIASGDAEKISEAGKLLFAFLKANGRSYHLYDGCEVLGDLLVASGKPAAASQFYSKVAEAPWPDYQMRAGVARGRALLAAGKADEALKTFQNVIDVDARGELADRQRMAATLGKARCLAENKQLDAAVKLAQQVIEKSDAEQSPELMAHAYNILGAAHRKAGRNKDALWAFLHVDVLYASEPSAHMEALQNLVPLWKEFQKPERAAEADRLLKEQYGKAE